jgi:hypothetical protein
MRILALVRDQDEVRRFLQALGEPTAGLVREGGVGREAQFPPHRLPKANHTKWRRRESNRGRRDGTGWWRPLRLCV